MHPLSIRPRDLPSNVRMSAGPSVNFHHHSVHPRDLPSTCVNSPFICVPSVNFRKYFVHPWDLTKRSGQLLVLPSASVNFLCILGTLRQLSVHPRDLQSTFCASVGSSINFPCGLGVFCQHFVWPMDLLSTLVNFPCLHGAFAQLSVRPWHFPSTFTVAGGTYVNFSYIRETLRQLP